MTAAVVRRAAAIPAAEIRGLGANGMLNVRCLVVLAAANSAVAAAALLGSCLASLGSGGGLDVLASTLSAGGFAVEALVFAILVACVPIAVVGVPAGVLTSRALRRVTREWGHVLVFGLVGATLAVVLITGAGIGTGIGTAPAWAALEGLVGAGGARWWSGISYRRDEREHVARAASLAHLAVAAGR